MHRTTTAWRRCCSTGPRSATPSDRAFWSDLPRFMAHLDADDDVRCVVIAAAGPHFSVGLDLTSFGAIGVARARSSGRARSRRTARCSSRSLRMQASVTSVAACRKPVSPRCTATASAAASTSSPRATCGSPPTTRSSRSARRRSRSWRTSAASSASRASIGAGHVAELALTGKDIDAERARQIGLVNDVYAGGAEGVRKAAGGARRGDRGELPARGPGDQGRPRRERRADRRRGARVRGVVEQPLPAQRRPHRGDDGVLREAAAPLHRALS